MKLDYSYSNLNLRVRLKFEPRDFWIGAFFAKAEPTMPWTRRIYVCLVPFLPIVISWQPRVRL